MAEGLLRAISAFSGSRVPGSGDLNARIADFGALIEKHTEAMNRHSDLLEKVAGGSDDFRMETLAALRVSTESINRLAVAIEKLLNVAKG